MLGRNINYIIVIAAAFGTQENDYFIFTSKPRIYFHSIGNLFFYPVTAIANFYVSYENACSIILYFKFIFFFKMTLLLLSLLFLQHENILPFSLVI